MLKKFANRIVQCEFFEKRTKTRRIKFQFCHVGNILNFCLQFCKDGEIHLLNFTVQNAKIEIKNET